MSSKIITKDFTQNYFSKRKKEQEKFLFGLNSTYIALLWIIAILLLYYVWILNANATQWYALVQLEIEKNKLLIEKAKLDVQIAELDSLSNIMNSEDLKNMEKVEDPDYLVIKDGIEYTYNY